MTLPDRRQRALAVAISALAGIATLAPVAHAQQDTDTSSTSIAGRRAARAAAQQAKEQKEQGADAKSATSTRYPNATRKDPKAKASAKGAKRLQELVTLFNAKKDAETRASADAIIGDAASSAYEKAFAAQLFKDLGMGGDERL